MIGEAESSQLSVNERLARAREQDLRRCRNLQAKLARAQLHDAQDRSSDLETAAATPKQHPIPVYTSSSSSSTGLMFLSSTELAQRERDQRSRERQLERQVAGPIPPESWRDDFDRLSIRRGVASYLDRRRLQDLVSATSAGDDGAEAKASEEGRDARRRLRASQAATCAGLRCIWGTSEEPADGSPSMLSLRDMTLCVIADALNRPAYSRGKDRAVMMPEMDRAQLREVLEYLPKHMQQRMLSLCGRLAATEWPLSEWTAQALIDLDKRTSSSPHHADPDHNDASDDDWETSTASTPRSSNPPSSHPGDSSISLDLSFSNLAAKTIIRVLNIGSTSFSLRMLSLAGVSRMDTSQMHAVFAKLPNIQTLSLAGSHLSSSSTEGAEDNQRAGVFLRKLSRSLYKLEVLDLSWCGWVSADAVQAVSWATRTTVAWPRMEKLLLTGCPAVTDPRQDRAGHRGVERGVAGNYVAQWHARHSQRDAIEAPAAAATAGGGLYDAYTDVAHRDPFDLFGSPATTQRNPTRATFGDYVNNTIQPAIITHMTPSSIKDEGQGSSAGGGGGGGGGTLMEYVRCPRSSGKIEMWQWQRARIVEALRGRCSPGARPRSWIDVYF